MVSARNMVKEGYWGQIMNFSSMGNDFLEVANRGMRRKVGSGSRTMCWSDCWVGKESL